MIFKSFIHVFTTIETTLVMSVVNWNHGSCLSLKMSFQCFSTIKSLKVLDWRKLLYKLKMFFFLLKICIFNILFQYGLISVCCCCLTLHSNVAWNTSGKGKIKKEKEIFSIQGIWYFIWFDSKIMKYLEHIPNN